MIQFHLLTQGLHVKAFFGTILAALSSLLAFDAELCALAFICVLGDLVTGVIAARRRGEATTSIGLRQTMVKVVEYLVFVIVANGIANAKTLQIMPGIEYLDIVAFGTITWIEFVSIVENIWGQRKGSRILKILTGRMKLSELSMDDHPQHRHRDSIKEFIQEENHKSRTSLSEDSEE